MRSVKSLIAAGAASLLSSMAFAADMAIAPRRCPMRHPVADFGGWYLRGDIGMTNQKIKSLDNPDPNAALFTQVGMGFDSATLFDLGIGYQFNNWFRADFTGQWRGRANFHGSQFTDVFAGSALVDNYSGSKSEAVLMAHAYVDLGTWWCVTPFIGAGIGTSYNRISGFRDTGLRNDFGVPGPIQCYLRRGQRKMEFCMGAARGSRLQSYAGRDARTRLQLHESRRCHDRLQFKLRWWPDPAIPVDHERHHLERLHARRAMGSRQPAGLRAAAGHQGLIAV